MIKILVPTDYSATADNAFLYALNLCKMYGGEILVMHSYKLDVYSIKGSAKATDEAELGRTLGAFDVFKEKVAAMRRLAEKKQSGSGNGEIYFRTGRTGSEYSGNCFQRSY